MGVLADILSEEPSLYMDLERSGLRASDRFDFLESTFLPVHAAENGENLTATASVNSMPDLCISEKLNSLNTIKRPSSTDILLSDTVDHPSQSVKCNLINRAEILSEILKYLTLD